MNIKNIALSALSLSLLALTSCSEGKYWDSPESYGVDSYAFAKPALTVEVPAEEDMPTVYNVPVSRSEAGEEVTVDVKFTTKTECLSGPSTVTFKKGELIAEYPISIDPTLIDDGFSYGATIALFKQVETEGKDGATVINDVVITKLDFNISHELILVWEDAGIAKASSTFAGNTEPVDIPVQVASNYPDKKKSLYRLVSPYWYLDPENGTEGHNIEFLCFKGSAYKADSLPEGWQSIGINDVDENGFPVKLFIGMPEDSESSFKSSKTKYSIKCAIGFSEYDNPSDEEVTVTDVMETLTFTWVHN